MLKLSIIMPVYNVSATVERSLESIAIQGLEDYELIVVDDSSKDNSAEIIKSFVASHNMPLTLICQEKNSGVAAARNRGLAAANGDYICFVDADDSLESGALDLALETAERTDADIVGWDWNLCLEKSSRYMAQRTYDSQAEALTNLMSGVMRWNLWLFLYRRQMICDNGIRFLDGQNMGEDMQFSLKAFSSARKVTQVQKALYTYNAVNDSSVSKQFSEERRKEVSANIAEVERFFSDKDTCKDLLQFLKLNIKLPLLVSGKKEDYLVWENWMSEADAFTLKNKLLPLRTRLLQWCASKGLWPLVKLYYTIVQRFVYGVLFR